MNLERDVGPISARPTPKQGERESVAETETDRRGLGILESINCFLLSLQNHSLEVLPIFSQGSGGFRLTAFLIEQ